MECMVQLRELTLSYRWQRYARQIFQGFDLCIPTGAYVSIIGSNGSGKSSLLKLILGLIVADAGDVWVGQEIVRQGYVENVRKNRIAYLAQRIESLFFGDTVDQELDYHGQTDGEKLQLLLNELGLEHMRGREIDTLSGGERQGVALAQFLVSPAPLLILDEPSSYLDHARSEILREHLKMAARQGRTILHATQFEQEINWGSHLLDLDTARPELVKL